MAKVRILVGVAGADFSWAPGDVVEMSEKSAEAWCDGLRAERVEPRAQGAGKGRGRAPEPEKEPAKQEPEKEPQTPPEPEPEPEPEKTVDEPPQQS